MAIKDLFKKKKEAETAAKKPSTPPQDALLDKELFEKVANRVYPGLAILARDVNLSPALADRYQKGQILREKAFVDASCRVMGMVTTHRYMILSNHMADLSSMEHGTNWGLCVAQRDAHFKVLDKYTYNGKTAIILLHLPDDESWKIYQKCAFNLDEQVCAMAKASFEKKCELPPVKELATEAWLKRCVFPIGMDDNGNFWPLE